MLENLTNNLSKKNYSIYQKLAISLKPYVVFISLAVISLVIAKGIEAGVLQFLVPKLPELFDEGIKKQGFYATKFIPGLILIAAVFRALFGFSTKFLIGYITKNLAKDLRLKILVHMLYLPVNFFKQQAIGSLIAKVNYDVEQVARALADSVLELLSSIVTIIFFIAVMFKFSWQLTIMALCLAPFIAYFLRFINWMIRKYSARLQQSVGDVSQLAHEIIEACKVIRIFAAIDQETNRINKLINYNFKQELKIILVSALSESIILITLSSVLVLLIYLAIVKNLVATSGEFLGLFGAMYGLIRPLKQLSEVNHVLARGVAAADSVFQFLAIPKEQQIQQISVEHNNLINEQILKNPIEIKLIKVSFYYTDHKSKEPQVVLSDLNLIFPAGKTTAIVGRSGSGKSTLVGLLPRFYQTTAGDVYLNGINLNKFELLNLRSYFAMVNQRVVLLNDSIANNIAYGCMRTASREQIIAAATMANAMEFIKQLPAGLDTWIGNNGNLLSGGQRQRIALARAILKNAPILILDEATSALDPSSEQQIQAALNKIMVGKTTIIIAHRLSTIQNADQIVVLDHGKIVGIGKHNELLTNTYYANLYKTAIN